MFNAGYIVGGDIDRIKQLPYPHFSKYPVPYIKGRQLLATEVGEVVDTFSLPFDAEFLSVAFSASAYCAGDYWELTIGDNPICERIYAKGLPESVSMGNSFGIVYPIEKGTPITFKFVSVEMPTDSAGKEYGKHVWYNIKFLRPENADMTSP